MLTFAYNFICFFKAFLHVYKHRRHNFQESDFQKCRKMHNFGIFLTQKLEISDEPIGLLTLSQVFTATYLTFVLLLLTKQ